MIKFFKNLFWKPRVEPEVLKLDYKAEELKIGFTLDYDLKNWEVIDKTMYVWENGVRDFEFTLEQKNEKKYLNYEPADQKFSIYWQEKLVNVCPDARKNMDGGNMDFNFSYEGKNYQLSSSAKASVKTSKERFNMVNWLFASDDENHFVSFNKYEDGSKEAYVGKSIHEHEVGNIFPSA